jgi:hypothetical protein
VIAPQNVTTLLSLPGFRITRNLSIVHGIGQSSAVWVEPFVEGR